VPYLDKGMDDEEPVYALFGEDSRSFRECLCTTLNSLSFRVQFCILCAEKCRLMSSASVLDTLVTSVQVDKNYKALEDIWLVNALDDRSKTVVRGRYGGLAIQNVFSIVPRTVAKQANAVPSRAERKKSFQNKNRRSYPSNVIQSKLVSAPTSITRAPLAPHR
jgi:hypothetical protein